MHAFNFYDVTVLSHVPAYLFIYFFSKEECYHFGLATAFLYPFSYTLLILSRFYKAWCSCPPGLSSVGALQCCNGSSSPRLCVPRLNLDSHPAQFANDDDPISFWQSPSGISKVNLSLDFLITQVRYIYIYIL